VPGDLVQHALLSLFLAHSAGRGQRQRTRQDLILLWSLCKAGRVATFDELVAGALNAPFSGWDFSWLAARSTPGTLPWSYQGEVTRRAAAAEAMLDTGTLGLFISINASRLPG
jgi:hypothetical protein